MVGDMKELTLEKVIYKSRNGKVYDNYNAKVTLRGVEKTLSFKSVGGKDVADVIFGDKATVAMRVTEGEWTNPDTNKKYPTYECEAYSEGEDGKEWTCKLKPCFDSDKAVLALFMQH